jgi:hypothetical protein
MSSRPDGEGRAALTGVRLRRHDLNADEAAGPGCHHGGVTPQGTGSPAQAPGGLPRLPVPLNHPNAPGADPL